MIAWHIVECEGQWSATWNVDGMLTDAGEPREGIALYPLEGPLDDYDRWDMEAKAVVLDAPGLTACLHAKIDAEAGEFRKRFITDAPGQQMTYIAKEAEARALAAGGDVGDAPMIAAGAAARGIEPAEMAAIVIARADAWRILGSAIEIARESAKAAVSAAASANEKRVAAVVDWDALLGGEG